MSAANYAECLRRVLVHEGGYTNLTADPGGPTNFGITIHDYRMYVKAKGTAADVRSMGVDDAKKIYKAKYWDECGCDDLPSGVDYAVFDYGVNSGTGRALKVLAKFPGLTPAKTVAEICDERLAFLKRLKTWPTFGAGWARRVRDVKAYAIVLADRGEPVVRPPLAPTRLPPPPDVEPVPAPAGKPVVKSKTFWASVTAAMTSVAGFMTDWKVLALVIVLVCVLAIVWWRSGKPDITGVFK